MFDIPAHRVLKPVSSFLRKFSTRSIQYRGYCFGFSEQGQIRRVRQAGKVQDAHAAFTTLMAPSGQTSILKASRWIDEHIWTCDGINALRAETTKSHRTVDPQRRDGQRLGLRLRHHDAMRTLAPIWSCGYVLDIRAATRAVHVCVRVKTWSWPTQHAYTHWLR